MPVHKCIFRAFPVVLVLLACSMARAQRTQENIIVRPDTIPCCENDIRWLKAASYNPALEASDIRVFVDTSKKVRNEITAVKYDYLGPADGAYYDCDIYVTERLKNSFTREELRVVLAHELGHLVNPRSDLPGSLQAEYDADKFAFDLMAENGEDPGIVLETLRRLFRADISSDPEETARLAARIKRVKSLLATEQGSY
jgi:Peptidase family M48